MRNFYSKLNLLLFLTGLQCCLCNNLQAQADFFLDSIAEAAFSAPTSGFITTKKYFYNSACKVSKILEDNIETVFYYGRNIITQEDKSLLNPSNYFRYESIFNASDQLVLYLESRRENLMKIDSFFYENDLLKTKKSYKANSSGNHTLVNRQAYIYNSANLLESVTKTDYHDASQDSVAFNKEEYKYDENLNILHRVVTHSGDNDKIFYDSTIYSYTADQRLYEKKHVMGSNFSAPNLTHYFYSYRDNTTIEIEYIFKFHEWQKATRTETQFAPSDYYAYDTLKIYEFISDSDSIISNVETNKLFHSTSGDTILHRNSLVSFDGLSILTQSVTKKFYQRYPEFQRHNRGSLAQLSIFPNPVQSGGVLQIPEVKFEFDKVIFYPVNGTEIQIVNVGRSKRYFNAPRESGMYIVQLWYKSLPVTEAVKVIVQ